MGQIDGYRKDYFEEPRYFWHVIINFGMGLTGFLAHFPGLMPYDSLGAIGAFLSFLAVDYYPLIPFIWVCALAAHAAEATAAYTFANNHGLTSKWKWALQTFFLGFPSLSLLTAYIEKTKKLESRKIK